MFVFLTLDWIAYMDFLVSFVADKSAITFHKRPCHVLALASTAGKKLVKPLKKRLKKQRMVKVGLQIKFLDE
jgi:hypothetical protein